MNAKETIPALAKLTPLLAAAGPPALIGVAIGAFVLWALSNKKKDAVPTTPQPQPMPNVTAQPPSQALPVAPPSQKAANRRIKREDIAEALEYGSRSVPRGEAVAALQALGFHKTAAYKALSASGRFAEFMEIAPDGLIEWKG
jgi:hypothetical protein